MDQRRIAVVEREDPARAADDARGGAGPAEGEANGHSGEYGTLIIHSHGNGSAAGRLRQRAQPRLIDNLPAGCCVEVPCLVDRNGVQPAQVGALPPQLAALMQTNINVQALTVRRR